MDRTTARRAFKNIVPGDTLAFTGGSTARVDQIGPAYAVLTRDYHRVVLVGADNIQRERVFARFSYWDVMV